MRGEKMKRLKEQIAIALIAGIMILSGCSIGEPSREDITKGLLKQRYGEDFHVYQINSEGDVWYATCSPAQNPEVVFEARFADNKWDDDDYDESYMATLLNNKFKNDLQKYFPEAYFHTKVKYRNKEKLTSINEKTLPEMINNIDTKYSSSGMLYIYYDKNKGTLKEYDEEFNYFEDLISNQVPQKRMIPITVTIFKVDVDCIDRLKEYYYKNVGKGESYYEKTVLGVENYEMGLISNDSEEIGNPPNISAAFNDFIVIEKEEYVRRRERIDNE